MVFFMQFLWLSNVGASGQDEVRRALTDADADVEVCVMGLVHAPVKTVSCRRTTAPPESLPRYKSYRLVRVATPKPPLRVAATTVYLSRVLELNHLQLPINNHNANLTKYASRKEDNDVPTRVEYLVLKRWRWCRSKLNTTPIERKPCKILLNDKHHAKIEEQAMTIS